MSLPSPGLRKMRSVRQIGSRKWHKLGKLGLIMRRGSVIRAALVSARANRIAAEMSDMHDGSSEAPYWQQGDTSLYTQDNLRRRMALRHDPDVIEALQLWWSCALRSMQQGGDSSASQLYKDQYVQVSLKIYRAMIDEDWDNESTRAEAEKVACEDWARDCCGMSWMERHHFMDAMFELADVWTQGMEPHEYAAFLYELFGHVAEGTPPDLYLWRPDDQIEYAGYRLRDEDEDEEEGGIDEAVGAAEADEVDEQAAYFCEHDFDEEEEGVEATASTEKRAGGTGGPASPSSHHLVTTAAAGSDGAASEGPSGITDGGTRRVGDGRGETRRMPRIHKLPKPPNKPVSLNQRAPSHRRVKAVDWGEAPPGPMPQPSPRAPSHGGSGGRWQGATSSAEQSLAPLERTIRQMQMAQGVQGVWRPGGISRATIDDRLQWIPDPEPPRVLPVHASSVGRGGSNRRASPRTNAPTLGGPITGGTLKVGCWHDSPGKHDRPVWRPAGGAGGALDRDERLAREPPPVSVEDEAAIPDGCGGGGTRTGPVSGQQHLPPSGRVGESRLLQHPYAAMVAVSASDPRVAAPGLPVGRPAVERSSLPAPSHADTAAAGVSVPVHTCGTFYCRPPPAVPLAPPPASFDEAVLRQPPSSHDVARRVPPSQLLAPASAPPKNAMAPLMPIGPALRLGEGGEGSSAWQQLVRRAVAHVQAWSQTIDAAKQAAGGAEQQPRERPDEQQLEAQLRLMWGRDFGLDGLQRRCNRVLRAERDNSALRYLERRHGKKVRLHAEAEGGASRGRASRGRANDTHHFPSIVAVGAHNTMALPAALPPWQPVIKNIREGQVQALYAGLVRSSPIEASSFGAGVPSVAVHVEPGTTLHGEHALKSKQ